MPTVRTDVLEIAYEAHGPADGRPLVLLHGWPDDARTWDRVAPRLAQAGYRVYCPYLRGYGPTRFLDPRRPRSGQLCALADDLLGFAGALGLQSWSVVGHDWGARAAYIAAVLAPQSIRHCVALSVGWGTNAPDQRLSLAQTRNYWYHWLFATPRGEMLLRSQGRELAHFMWTTWSPGWSFPQVEFEITAQSFQNPDWASVCLHSYRHRWGWADGDPAYQALEERLAATPRIAVPTLVLHGGRDAANAPETSEGRESLFDGPYERQLVPESGHFPQREQPDSVTAAILGWLAGQGDQRSGAPSA
ncbi:alpha/beta fold hydrolase [Bordetella sp. 2513F-2]